MKTILIIMHSPDDVMINSYEIVCPFKKEDVNPDDLEFFKDKIEAIYKEFLNGTIGSTYDIK